MAEDNRKARVVIVERDPYIAEMEASALDTEGYEARSLLAAPGIVEDVARLQPDLVILDLYPLADNPYWILDELRANPATQAVPVLAASTMETLAEKALASYNVRVTLEKPFGLEDFLAKVREALNQPPLHADVPKRVETAPLDLVEQAAGVVARYSRGTLFRWVQRLRQEPPWKDRQDLDLGKVLNDVPVLVEALSIALQYRSADEMLSHQPEIAERVRRHAELRKRQGFSLSGLIREYDLLRDELLAMLELHLPTEIHAADLFTVVRLVNGTLDRIMEITIPAYASAPEASTGNLPRAA